MSKKRCQGRTYRINPDKLLAQFEALGIHPGEASTSLGYARGYFTDVLRRELITKPGMIALEAVYGIDYADYCEDTTQADEEVIDAESEKEVKTIADLTPAEFSELMYKVIYGAVNHVLNAPYTGNTTDK